MFPERNKGEFLYFSGVGFISRMNFMFLLYSFYDPKPEIIPDDDDEWKLHFCACSFSSAYERWKNVQHDIDNSLLG